MLSREQSKARWRIQDLLAEHVRHDDDRLSDIEFVQEVVRRWGKAKNLTLSIGICQRETVV